MTNSNRPLPPVLAEQLARVLRRYRRVRLLRASARFLAFSGAAAALLAVAAAGGAPVAPLSGVAIAAVAFLATYCFLPILRRPATLQEIAAHIDARHPELQDRILSAVALAESGNETPSAWMLENLLAETQQRVIGTPLDDFMNPLEYRVLVAAVCAGGAVIVAGLIAAGWRWSAIQDALEEDTAALAAAPFTVEPGDATVQPGDNQIIWVTSPDVNATRYILWEQGGREQRAVLATSSTPEVSFHTFEALREGLFYRVRVGERESERYEIKVARPPSVESIQVTYTYPAYLGLEPRVVPFAGDIEAVEGTEVALRVEVNKPLRQAVLALDTGSQIPLAAAGDLAWETVFTLEDSGAYQVALQDEAGEINPMPARYAITVLPDNPPAITVRYPRGDTEVLALEEVPLAFTVEDDFGVSGYGIEYTIAGREPVRLALSDDSPLAREIVGDHLLALEAMALEGGDLITWSVWATDQKPDRADFEVAGDPFFLEVRPYVRRYRESITNAGGGAATGEAGQGRDPLGDQRGVVIALHNLRKRASGLGEETYTTDAGRIAEAQGEIRGTLEGGLGMAPPDQAILGRRALESMTTVQEAVARAVWPEPEEALGEALAAAQEAMQWLKKLEPELRDVMRAQGGGGGGGGGGSAQGEIDQLELARRTGFQEEARTSQQAAAEQEALRKGLEDLARRQEVLNEDLGALQSENEAARDEQERARQLERLREEQQRQLERLDQLANELARSPMDAAQREEAREALQEARRNMETSAESARRGELQQARSAGSRAARDLESVERNLDMLTREAAADRLAALEEGMRGLRERQVGVREEVDALREMESVPGLEEQERLAARSEQLRGEKELLARDTEALIRDAGGLSDQLRQNQELLSRKLGDWARRTSRDGVVTDMESGLRYVEWGAWEPLAETERQVDRKLDQAAEALSGLRRFLPGDEEDDLARALDMLQELGGVSEEAGEASESGEAGPGGESRAETDSETGRGEGETARDGDGAGAPSEMEGRETLARRPDASGAPNGQGNGEPSADGEQPGSQSAPRDGQPPEGGQESGERAGDGDAPGETASEQSGGANGDTPGEGAGAPGEGAAPGEGGGAPGGEGGESGREGVRGDGGSGIQTSETFRGGGTDSRDDFFDQDIWDWRPTIRDAASLLPRESSVRGALEQVEMDLGRLQREYNNGKQLPDAAEFEQVVRRPLRDAIAALEDEVRARLEGERQWIEDEGAVPPQYADRVSEYFRTLSETPAAP